MSVSKLGRFLADKAEEAGVYILAETAADKLLVEDRIVKGVRSGDRGRGKEGEELGNFEPGSDVIAKATVLAEGTIGHLTYSAYDYFGMTEGSDPQAWELGVKEVWEVPKPLDRVIHTLGWPLRWGAKYKEAGGSFIYPMGEDKVCFGLVVGLDYTDATFSVHDELQRFKQHPFIKKIIEGGKRVGWGAKTIPSGGYFSLPKRFSVPGMLVAGDCAGMVNIAELAGVHYAMHAGMYAAEAIVESLKKDIDSVNFESYDEAIRNSVIEKDLYKSRNMKQPLSKGLIRGGIVANMLVASKGNFPPGHMPVEDNAEPAMHLGNAGGALSRSPTTRSPSTSSTRSSSPATRPATTRPTTCASRPGCRASSPRRGSRCARRRSTRSPTSSWRTAPPRSTSTSPPPTASSAARSPPRAGG